jgi:hypothetical protein
MIITLTTSMSEIGFLPHPHPVLIEWEGILKILFMTVRKDIISSNLAITNDVSK